MARKKRITSAELMARLQSDPEWVRQNAEREARHKAAVAKLQAELEPEETPLLADLAKAGYVVSSVWDLVNTRASYQEAIPVLSRHLQIVRHPALREGIARALTVKEARGAAGHTILVELKREYDAVGSEARWALANALTVAADASMTEDLEALVADARYEDVHERLNTALKKLRRRKRRRPSGGSTSETSE